MPVDEGTSPDQAMYDTLDPTLITPLTDVEQGGAPGSTETASPQFDERYKQPMHGLLFVGALKERFTWLGHEFCIRTLRSGEYGEVAMAANKYVGTQFEGKAFQAATVAACVMTVDGQPLPVVPLTVDQGEIQVKFDYVLGRWHSPVIDYVFSQFYELESVVRELIEELGKSSG